MFISQQTYKGLKLSVNAIIETVQFLLQHEVRLSVNRNVFSRSIRNYFGRQRSIGGRKDNPPISDFKHNDNSIRNQKVFRPIVGNVRGIDETNIEFTNEPIPYRKKAKNYLNDFLRYVSYTAVYNILTLR